MKGGSGGLPFIVIDRRWIKTANIMKCKKIALTTFVALMVFANCCFASLAVRTISSSDFNSYISAKNLLFLRRPEAGIRCMNRVVPLRRKVISEVCPADATICIPEILRSVIIWNITAGTMTEKPFPEDGFSLLGKNADFYRSY